MTRTRSLVLGLLFVPLVGASGVVLAGGGPPAPPPPPPPAGGAPAAPAASDPFVLGERAVDEAMRWIAKGETPVNALTNLHADIDYHYDDGSNKDERQMELWFRNPDAFRANFAWGGVPTTFLLIGQRGWMIRDTLHVRDLNNDSTVGPKVLPMLENYRSVLQEVGRMLAPKSAGARFRLEGMVPDRGATGGQWFKVIRTAPREPNMAYFFGSMQRKDGAGIRAIAPDRMIIYGEPGTTYQGDDYRLEGWLRDDPVALRESIRYPKRIRLYAIGIDPEDRPTMRAVVNSLDLNQYFDPNLLTPPY